MYYVSQLCGHDDSLFCMCARTHTCIVHATKNVNKSHSCKKWHDFPSLQGLWFLWGIPSHTESRKTWWRVAANLWLFPEHRQLLIIMRGFLFSLRETRTARVNRKFSINPFCYAWGTDSFLWKEPLHLSCSSWRVTRELCVISRGSGFAPCGPGDTGVRRASVGLHHQEGAHGAAILNSENCICDSSSPWQCFFYLRDNDMGKGEIQAALLCLWVSLLNDSFHHFQCWWKRLSIEFLKIIQLLNK